jgi:hypothetical protein
MDGGKLGQIKGLVTTLIGELQRATSTVSPANKVDVPISMNAAQGEVDIYVTPGERTASGSDYVGSTKHDSRLTYSGDGRARQPSDVVATVPEADRRRAEQQEMNDRGGVDKLDNRRNEIAPCKWPGCGVEPPKR